MKWVCVKDNIVQNIIVPSEEPGFVEKYLIPQYDSVLEIENDIFVANGFSYDPDTKKFSDPQNS